ncbi:MAG: sugar ABC transporter permease [Candidatus Bipolaricaulota bacterium]|nr:sugar ABC transporter permease [Candidatus Bipolaricaulota bacterium]MDW8127205.1 sugar ABC transporter permease [Candidatus Bipolaricaulota bacterium]
MPRSTRLFGLWFERRIHLWLLLPAGFLFLFLTVFPLAYNAYISLHHFHFVRRVFYFTGGRNYLRLFQDGLFLAAIGNTLRFVALATATEVLLGTGLALLFNVRLRGRRILLPLAVLPMMLPTMVVCAVWVMLYDYEFGFLNQMVRSLGGTPVPWLSHPGIAMEAIVLVDLWQWTPFVLLLILAGLQSIPDYLYEAAQLDGASGFQMFRHITLPLLSFQIKLAVLLRLIDTFRVFDKVYAMTGGGPGYATETISLYIYREGFRYFHLGYAGAASLVMVFLVLGLSVLYARRMWKELRL